MLSSPTTYVPIWRSMRAIPTAFVLLILAAGATACSKDPAKAKLDFVASGDRYMADKKYDEAIIQYRNAVKVDPKFGEARLKLADALTVSDNGQAAFGEYVRAADLLPTNVVAQLRAGQMLLLAKQYPEARARAEKILEVNPQSVDGLLLMGNAMAGLKDFDSAIEQIEGAIGEDPNQPLNYANLAVIQSAKGDKTAAEAALKAAQPELQRAATKGVVHRNTASRKISRLASRVNAISA